MKTALDLVQNLVNIADALVANHATQISDATLRTLREEVAKSRLQLSETEFAVDYEATCLIECVSELAYARTDGDLSREQRAIMYIHQFRKFLRFDCEIAARKAGAS